MEPAQFLQRNHHLSFEKFSSNKTGKAGLDIEKRILFLTRLDYYKARLDCISIFSNNERLLTLQAKSKYFCNCYQNDRKRVFSLASILGLEECFEANL